MPASLQHSEFPQQRAPLGSDAQVGTGREYVVGTDLGLIHHDPEDAAELLLLGTDGLHEGSAVVANQAAVVSCEDDETGDAARVKLLGRLRKVQAPVALSFILGVAHKRRPAKLAFASLRRASSSSSDQPEMPVVSAT